MDRIRIIAIVLIVAGALALMYGGFTYTKESHDLKIGSLEVSVKDKETVNIPTWCGTGAIIVGIIMLVAGRQRA